MGERMTKAPSLTVEAWTDSLDIDRDTAKLIAAAEERMRQARRGYPSSGMGGRGTGGNTSPVEKALGLTSELDDEFYGEPVDLGAKALHKLRDLIRQHRTSGQQLYNLVNAWAPHHADAKAKEETAEANDPMCAHCTRWVKNTNHAHVFNTDVTGNLSEPVAALCRWCYDFVRNTGRLPTENECKRHDNGQRIRLPA